MRPYRYLSVQSGHGTIVAQATVSQSSSQSPSTTFLTQLSHQSPARLVPLTSSAVQQAGSAMIYLCHYGGGMLCGDQVSYHVHVGEHAKVGLLTQGSQRLYPTQRFPVHHHHQSTHDNPTLMTQPPRMTTTRVHATVERHGCLVIAPDPVTPLRESVSQQITDICLDPQASLCCIDWVSAGRLAQGEWWQHTQWQSHTRFTMTDDNSNSTEPVLMDGCAWPLHTPPMASQWPAWQVNAVATVYLYAGGAHAEALHASMRRWNGMARQLAQPYTRIRSAVTQDTDTNVTVPQVSHQVMMGVSYPDIDVDDNNDTAHDDPASPRWCVVRLVAASNEDVYHLLECGLAPLASSLGVHLYRDRLHARSAPSQPVTLSAMPVVSVGATNNKPTDIVASDKSLDPKTVPTPHTASALPDDDNSPTDTHGWSSYVLADAALPTGGFAHSSGLEAAHQLGWIRTVSDVEIFVQAAVRSTLQQWGAFVVTSHALYEPALSHNDDGKVAEITKKWVALDQQLHASMVVNPLACRASLDQGRALLRILQSDTSSSLLFESLSTLVQDDSHRGHWATVLGMVAAHWNLSASTAAHVMGYCISRDIVSAAVRLNLVGPVASVAVLQRAQTAAKQGMQDSMRLYREHGLMGTTCAPAVDALSPCHELLMSRLFRS
jgi:urease accessory protein